MRTLAQAHYPNPIIQLAERDDIPELVHVWLEAERPSVVMFYHLPTEEDKARFSKQMIMDFESNFDNPDIFIAKAVDPETDRITAMAVWQKKGFARGDTDMNDLFAVAGLRLKRLAESSRESGPDRLGRYIEAQFNQFLASWAQHSKYLYLALLMTHPDFQRRGIGTRMLQWGHEYADKSGIPAFLVASPVGHPLYQHVGWKDVDTPLQIDMRQWVAGAQNGDMGWGVHTYYYMLRMPRTAEV